MTTRRDLLTATLVIVMVAYTVVYTVIGTERAVGGYPLIASAYYFNALLSAAMGALLWYGRRFR